MIWPVLVNLIQVFLVQYLAKVKNNHIEAINNSAVVWKMMLYTKVPIDNAVGVRKMFYKNKINKI